MGWLVFSAGVLLEVVGIVLAWLEIRSRRAQVEAYEAEPRPVITVTASTATGALAMPVLSGDGRTVEERIARLESAITRLPFDLSQTKRAAVNEAEKHARGHVNEAARTLRAEHARTTRLLLGTVTDTKRPRISIACLMAGLVLQALGSVLLSQS
jgi:predicted nucleic acid-binding protein